MANFDFGQGADALTLHFTSDGAGDIPRIAACIFDGNGSTIGGQAENVLIEAPRGSYRPDTVTLRGDFPPDAECFVTIWDDPQEANARRVHHVGAEINGVPIEDAATDFDKAGDYGPLPLAVPAAV